MLRALNVSARCSLPVPPSPEISAKLPATMQRCAKDTARLTTVEDHYAPGGLGDAVSEAVWDQGFSVQRLAVREIPRSGEPDELLERYGISAAAIVRAVKNL